MKRLLLLIATMSAFAAWAQSPVKPVKALTDNNPINPFNYCADPTAVEYNGRLYVYGTNDHQQFDYTKGKKDNDYGQIRSIVVMSTEDMVNWTWHGAIDMAAVCKGWIACSWAPSITSRVEADGLTHFYLYFANSGGGVGVVTATSPLGPWSDPLGHPLITYQTPGLGDCCWPFDPGVVIDESGTGWLAFGGGDPKASDATALMPRNTRLVKLGDDMISFASDIIELPTPYHFEASELNIIGGKFVYSYCTSWADRVDADWATYSTTVAKPTTCSMCYMTSTDPLNPNSWIYEGQFFSNPGDYDGFSWGNNHTHFQKFKGKYYLIYHNKALGKATGYNNGYRSLAINEMEVDEVNVKIPLMKSAPAAGPAQIVESRPNIEQLQQAATIWNASGVNMKFNDTKEKQVVSSIKMGGWTAVKQVVANNDVKSFSAKLKGTGVLEVRVDGLDAEAIAKIEFSSTEFANYSVNLTKSLNGVHNIFFVFTRSDNEKVEFEEWQFNSIAIAENTASTYDFENTALGSYTAFGATDKAAIVANPIVCDVNQSAQVLQVSPTAIGASLLTLGVPANYEIASIKFDFVNLGITNDNTPIQAKITDAEGNDLSQSTLLSGTDWVSASIDLKNAGSYNSINIAFNGIGDSFCIDNIVLVGKKGDMPDEPTYCITVVANDTALGSVSYEIEGYADLTALHVGDYFTVTATPKDNCKFVKWSDGLTKNPRRYTVGVSDAKLTAYFDKLFPDAINTNLATDEVISIERFDITGRRLLEPENGINIIRKTYKSGRVASEKVFVNIK
ncbi:MAG: glycoside hydrolase family 43 protein [Salinivirgaceae bacterium]|nr:glycoside hydrolase family 43 protein [Salinivirgaceae bacterium]